MYTNYRDLDEGDLATIEESMNLPYDPMEPFSVFITRIEDGIDLVEATGAPYSKNQIIKKAANLIVKAQCFPEGIREWKRKAAIDQTWATFKIHFGQEAKEYRKNNTNTARSSGYQVVNTANQALLEAQQDFRTVTDSFISDFKKAMEHQQTNPAIETPSQYQPTIQQAAFTSNDSSLQTIIKELREQNAMLLKTIAKLSENKENEPKLGPNTPRK